MSDYKLANDDFVVRVRDVAFIPLVDGNADYAEYKNWLAAGNTPLPADPAPVIERTVTPRQIRLALTQAGMRDAVEAYVSGASRDVKDSWEYSTVFERNHPLLVAAGAALNKTEAEIDALFDLAASL